MEAQAILVSVILPFKNEFFGKASYVEVPALEGVMGILPGHEPVIAQIATGVLKIKPVSGSIREFKIAGGFIRLDGGTCKILTKNITPT